MSSYSSCTMPQAVSFLHKEKLQLLQKAIEQGAHAHIAARLFDVTRRTFNMWLAQGRRDLQNGAETEYSALLLMIERAEARAEKSLVEAWIRQARSETNWRAARDFLERRFPERWAKADRNAVEDDDESKVPLKLTLVDDVEDESGDDSDDGDL